jgi:hypothetical protein
MASTSNYGFNRTAQFSVNHMAEYLTTENASQRTKIIGRAKFPKKIEVAAYAQVRRPIQNALTKPNFDKPSLELFASRLAAKAVREEGYQRDEALRCEKAVRAFLTTFESRSLKKCAFGPAPSLLALQVERVRLKISLDATITAESDGVTNSGGMVLLYAFSSGRDAIHGRLSAATGLIFWALEGGQMEPLAKLCMAADIAGNEIVKASNSFSRFRGHVSESCSEIAARWDSIRPPHDYDGPRWD